MKRVWIVFFLIIFQFSLIVVKLFYLQVSEGQEFKEKAKRQHNYSLTIPASRGLIKTSDNYPLVMNQPTYLVYAQPKEIENLSDYSHLIGPLIKKDPDQLILELSESDKLWYPLSKKTDAATYEKLSDFNLKGLGFEKQSKRFYPEASMAAHLLGFVGADENDNDIGYFGVEGYYNLELKGKDGSLNQEKDAKGTPLIAGNIKRIDSEDGRTLVLWLDRAVQKIAEEELLTGIRKYGAKEGSVVIMDPSSGGILAMSSYPNYNPVNINEYENSLYKNPIIASSYEPGSTFKVLVMSAAIEEAAVKPDTKYNEAGPIRIGEYSIRTWNNKYHGEFTVTDILVHSSNVGMVYIGSKLGNSKLINYIKSFGLGEVTGIDLQEESTPDIRPDNQWKEIDYATATFGQGIAVTPIQMVRAVSVIANKGWLMEPEIVKQVIYPDGRVHENKSQRIRRVISESAASITTEMMVAAVEKGEAKWTRLPGLRVAGKTGTAQIPVAGNYDEEKTIASFVGFAPADNPKFVILVTLREPTSSPWGSETAAPLFFNIVKKLYYYYDLAGS